MTPNARYCRNDEWATPVVWFLSAAAAGAGCVFLVLYALVQPMRLPNPGLAAYTPPPGTRLLPLPRESTAPELAEGPRLDDASPVAALALAEKTGRPARRESTKPVRKRVRVEPRRYEQREAGFSQQWNDEGSRDWNRDHGWGGGRSWF
jgi:negative regulator of sigma E activity